MSEKSENQRKTESIYKQHEQKITTFYIEVNIHNKG